MSPPLQVYILLSVDPDNATACTLVLDSIRTGFPTAHIHVTINVSTPFRTYIDDAFYARLDKISATNRVCAMSHHADWIRMTIQKHPPELPCILLDGDMIFWKSCEEFKFTDLLCNDPEPLYAGYFIPTIYNDFAQCVSFPRLHTSFLWIPNTLKLLEAINNAYPNATKEGGNYCPVDPFHPRVIFTNRHPFFYDTCSTLYNMVGGKPFTRDQLDHYEHLNSASFYDVMEERMENKVGFYALHKVFAKKPESLRGFSRLVDGYYQKKHLQAVKMIQDGEARLTRDSSIIDGRSDGR